MDQALSPGTTVGQYRIDILVGEGGFGRVYKATHPTMGWIRAIKQLHLPEQSMVARFRQEAQILMTLNHPNLPRIYDYITQGGSEYIVMEWVDGNTLTHATKHRQVPEVELIALTKDILEALIYLHTQNSPIYHRDVKPDNIMKDWGRAPAKLMDLGIARVAAGRRVQRTVVGTLYYASPQQLKGEDPCPSDDIFGLGASLYEAVAPYQLAWQDKVIPSPYERVDGPEEVERTLSHIHTVSDPFKAIIKRALAYQRSDRYATATEMLAAVTALSGLSLPSPSTPPPIVPPSTTSPSTSLTPPVSQAGWNPLRKKS